MNDVHIKNDVSFEIKLHPLIINILFNHRNDISNKLRDIIGIYSIDHVAIHILDPKNEITIFSRMPSVEYNLIVNELWRYDKSFASNHLPNRSMYCWNDLYHSSCRNELLHTKEHMHKFTFGISLIRKINGYTLTYSFATRNTFSAPHEYYFGIKNELLQVGDYTYNLIRDIYKEYSYPYIPPVIENAKPSIHKKHLRLISSN